MMKHEEKKKPAEPKVTTKNPDFDASEVYKGMSSYAQQDVDVNYLV